MSGILFSVLATTCLLLASCSGKSDDPTDDPTQGAPSDFSLSFGEGGGMTGQWSGVTMSPDRAVSWWAGRYEGHREERTDSATDDAARSLWSAVTDAVFFEMDPGEPGNVSRFIEATADSATHRVTWAVGDPSEYAKTLDDLYNKCHSVFTDHVED